jgi:hypothetical protein
MAILTLRIPLLNILVVNREVVKMRELLILLILFTFTVPAYAATIHKWVDEKGVVYFTDDYNNIPSSCRDQVEAKEYLTEGVAPAYTLDAPPQKRAEAQTDIYGRDETWWREQVHPWKEQLKEATENYGNAHKQYMEQAEGLSPYNFGKMSLTQYQMLSARLQILNAEMEKYQGQIAEANETLGKLSQEARETKADPAWLE